MHHLCCVDPPASNTQRSPEFHRFRLLSANGQHRSCLCALERYPCCPVKPDLEVSAERAFDVAFDAARARLAGASTAPEPKRTSLPARRRPATAGVAVVGAGAKAARGPNLVKNGIS
jgi:hypothetical protein